RNGMNGRRALPDAQAAAKAGIGAEQQLIDIRQHLDDRLKSMNDRWAGRTKEVTEHTVVKGAFSRADAGEFPKNSSILFIEKGKICRDANGSPMYFVVYPTTGTRLPSRLIGKNPDTYIVVAPRLGADGEPIVIRRDKGPGAKPSFMKEVIAT